MMEERKQNEKIYSLNDCGAAGLTGKYVDERSVDEVYQALLERHLQPVMSDYIYV